MRRHPTREMHTAFAIIVAGLLVSLSRLCKAQGDQEGCFIYQSVRGNPQFNTFFTDGDFSLLQKCFTSSAFCSSLFASTIPPTTTIEVFKTVTQSTGKPRLLTSDKFVTVFTATETFTAAASTLTVGSSTTTVSECGLTNTIACAAVTFGFFAHDNDGLTQGCKCILNQSTATSTLPSAFTTMVPRFSSTTTLSTTFSLVKSVTVEAPVATTSVDLLTVRTCHTLQRPPHHCRNHGVQWAYYPIMADDVNGTPDNLTLWDPAVYKSRIPTLKGHTNLIGDLAGEYYEYGEDVYENVVPMNDVAVIFRGYIFAEQNGTYSFVVGDVVNIANVWVGDVAYSGWNLANADTFREFGTKKVHLEAGKYHPFRVAWGLGQSTYQDNYYYGLCYEESTRCGFFYFHIARPDGTVVVGYENFDSYSGYTPNNQYSFADQFFESADVTLQFSCDRTSAPKFQRYGHET